MSGKSIRLTGGAGWGLTRACPACGQAETACRCNEQPTALPPSGQVARLRLEKRWGKSVTVVAGLVLNAAGQEALLKELRARCGAGGTSKAGDLEIQGDHRETIQALLAGEGFRCKSG